MKEPIAILILSVTIGSILAIVILQRFRIRTFRKLFRELSDAFSGGRELDYHSLVEHIIRSREMHRAGPAIEANERISGYIKEIIGRARIFIHVAPDVATAESIMKEGFRYSEDFQRTTQEISADLSDLDYKLQLGRPYGTCIIILAIPRDLFRKMIRAGTRGNEDMLAEYGISKPDHMDEMRYVLPPHFVCGYFDTENQNIVENKSFSIRS